jgi:peptidoglycan/LPS O-acetylase OafA/YrhL
MEEITVVKRRARLWPMLLMLLLVVLIVLAALWMYGERTPNQVGSARSEPNVVMRLGGS